MSRLNFTDRILRAASVRVGMFDKTDRFLSVNDAIRFSPGNYLNKRRVHHRQRFVLPIFDDFRA